MKTLFFILFPLFLFSQNENIEKMKKLPKAEFEKAFNDSIVNLKSLDLWNFIKSSKESEIDLNNFNSTFISRLDNAEWPIEMHFLTIMLIEQKTEKTIIENILNNKRNIWDKGEWSEKFWKLIRENNFVIKENLNYSVNEKGEKKYDLKLFIEEKIKNNEIGQNPILDLNYSITDYTENQLLETLEKLDIKDIQIIPKNKSVGLFGKRGIDGVIKVLTK
jgi:hypothetical protein